MWHLFLHHPLQSSFFIGFYFVVSLCASLYHFSYRFLVEKRSLEWMEHLHVQKQTHRCGRSIIAPFRRVIIPSAKMREPLAHSGARFINGQPTTTMPKWLPNVSFAFSAKPPLYMGYSRTYIYKVIIPIRGLVLAKMNWWINKKYRVLLLENMHNLSQCISI